MAIVMVNNLKITYLVKTFEEKIGHHFRELAKNFDLNTFLNGGR